jgi:hypothetical protein
MKVVILHNNSEASDDGFGVCSVGIERRDVEECSFESTDKMCNYGEWEKEAPLVRKKNHVVGVP